MAKSLFLAAPLILQALPGAFAWGTLGHDTVAYIAQNFVTSATKTFCQNILADTSTSYLANVATWADTYRYTSEGSFSAPYHFIDAEDDPPSSCNVDYNRDCGSGGCVVSAIQNYTSRVVDTSLSTTEVQKALKWIVHFIGDIHQPLHDEALDIGGNTIDVTFDGTSTNLHHIWDTNMPEKLVGGYTLTDAKTWAKTLTTSIKTGAYSSQKSSWLSGINIDDPITTAMGWATDSNAYVCSTVLPDGVSAVSGQELDGSYYTTAVPVIELQIAKAGYRLAAWLNLIATGSTGLKVASKPRGAPMIEAVKVMPRDFEAEMSPAKLARMAYGHKC
ncbi:S1/P1 nuclease [Lepidopterella palustris CBS 459.81]|uniref:S1/P1 nuclease n=1 Tax=Lepidopterella palustris CBS 459.81 TaxID=1314670 RepID=A0A8E2EBN1_9PEZI|nr:S1/P1 nuclease [Lepidopterella palustris CBS 459.81]